MQLPSLHGNWVDLLLILFIILYLWENWGRGFIQLIFQLLVFFGAFALSLKLYPTAAKILIDNFTLSKGMANALGFAGLGIVIEQLLSYIADKIHALIPQKLHKHKYNIWLSVLPLFGTALVISAFMITLILALPLRGWLKQAVSSSKIGKPLITHTQKIERSFAQIFGEALTETVNFISTGPVSSREQVKLNFTQKDLEVDEVAEIEMINKVNLERRIRGLAELRMDNRLRSLSRVYATDMFERGFFSHYNPEGKSPFDRMQSAGIEYITAGENLALSPSTTIAHEGLMNSQGHRENILNPEFGKIGIGIIDGGIYGKMFVQEFTD